MPQNFENRPMDFIYVLKLLSWCLLSVKVLMHRANLTV